MGRIVLVAVLVLVVFAAVYRERIYLWDPMATVTRSGEKVDGARVFLNFGNDIIVQEQGGSRMWAVQHWNGLETVPTQLNCVQGLMCLAPAEHMEGPAGTAVTRRVATMTAREVDLTDEEGRPVMVTLR